MSRFWGMVGLAGSLAGLLMGCDVCGGHANGATYCKGRTVVQCRDNYEFTERECAPSECKEVTGQGHLCILPATTCPTANLGYQCMGDHRIRCLPGGRVEDIGACPRPLPPGSPTWSSNSCTSDVNESQEECYPPKAPYCVENPGGEALACGWKKEMCSVEGEVRCFEDGSAICAGHVYTAFVSNSAAGQSVCSVTPVEHCWKGKTWCEGDVLKRCDRCLGEHRCSQVTTEMVCEPGACTAYAFPTWLGRASQTIPRDAMGCAIAAPACVDATGTVCAGDRPAVCVSPGKAVVALSCSEFQTTFGGSPAWRYFGPYCVSGEPLNAACAEDPIPCDEQGLTRCDPADPSGVRMQRCVEGVWFQSESCDKPNKKPPTTQCQAGTPYASCQ
jgi:hypothetical protein